MNNGSIEHTMIPTITRMIRAGVIRAGLAGLAMMAAATGTGTLAQTPDQASPSHGIAMHGELKFGPGFTHFGHVNATAPKGGKVKLASIGTFDSLNPFIIKGVAAGRIGLIYDTLMAGSDDEAFSMYGRLAKTIETPKDRSWVAFTLRPEARFHDGSPITADDVMFSFNILRDKGSPFWGVYYGNVTKIEKTSKLRVKFTFRPGENRELPLILGQFPILPKAYWQSRDFAKTTLEPPLGSGPYRIESLEPGRSITYRRDKAYWGRNLPVNVGSYNFDVIHIDYYRDATVAREALKTGGFDFRAENESKAWATAYNIPAVKAGQLIKKTFQHKRSSGMQAFVFNTRRAMFKDPRVREALAFAFDFEWTNKNLFYGQYTRTESFFSNSELASFGLPKGNELKILEGFRGRIPDQVFAKTYKPPSYDGSGNIRPGQRAAMRMFKQAGWVVRNKKLVNAKTNRQMNFEILLVSPAFERIVLPFAHNLKRMGIRARPRLVDPAQYQNRLRDFDFDMVIGSFGQSLSPGNEQRDYWSSRAADIKGSRNIVGIKDKVIDELIEMMIAAPDRKSLVDRVRALDRVLLWKRFIIPQWHIPYDRLVFWNKFGYPKKTPIRGTSFDNWWIDADKAGALKRKLSKTKAN